MASPSRDEKGVAWSGSSIAGAGPLDGASSDQRSIRRTSRRGLPGRRRNSGAPAPPKPTGWDVSTAAFFVDFLMHPSTGFASGLARSRPSFRPLGASYTSALTRVAFPNFVSGAQCGGCLRSSHAMQPAPSQQRGRESPPLRLHSKVNYVPVRSRCGILSHPESKSVM